MMRLLSNSLRAILSLPIYSPALHIHKSSPTAFEFPSYITRHCPTLNLLLTLSTVVIKNSILKGISEMAFPLTNPPDWALCSPWFAHPVRPILSDCQVAFTRLPVNEDPIQYRPLRRNLDEPKGLLVTETHSQYTTALQLLSPTLFCTID